MRIAARVMGQMWGIGKRRFGKRRIWLFDRLMWTVARYRMEIWGWKKRKEIEALHTREVLEVCVRGGSEDDGIYDEREASER